MNPEEKRALPEADEERARKRRTRVAVLAFIALAASAVLCVLYFGELKRLMTDPAFVRAWVKERGALGPVLFFVLTVAQTLLAVIPGEPLELAAGYAFGAVKGTALCLLAEGAASAAILIATRRYGRGIAGLFFSEEKLAKLRFLSYSPKRMFLFSLIFLLPGTPKDMLCYWAGLTDADMRLLILVCTAGRIPAIITSTIGGHAIGSERYALAVAVLAATAAVSLAGIAAYERICRKHGK